MKKGLLASVLLLGLLTVLLVVPAFSSSSAPNSVPRQLRQLNAKVRVLQSRVTLLEKSVAGIKACTSTVQGLTRFNGYVWSDGVNNYLTTAVDVPDTGEAVGAYFVLADPRCVSGGSSSRLFSLAKPSRAIERAASGDRLNGLAHPHMTRPPSRPSERMSPLKMSR